MRGKGREIYTLKIDEILLLFESVDELQGKAKEQKGKEAVSSTQNAEG